MPIGGPTGGGQAGFGSGGSFTGPAEALEILGDHAYCIPGPISPPTDASPITCMEFTSGNYYLVGDLTTTGALIAEPHSSGFIDAFSLFFNDVEVMRFKIDSGEEDMPAYILVPIVIPSYTKVKLTTASSSSNASWLTSSQITGRIYRG